MIDTGFCNYECLHLAGIPFTFRPSGTLFVTTAPAATTELLPIVTPLIIVAPGPINELSPIKGFNSYNFLVAKLAYKILSYKFLY